MHSMTGYGAAQRETPQGRLSIEIRSVNNRFLELNFRLPSIFNHLEPALRKVMRERLNRGKVDVYVRFEPSDEFVPGTRINVPLLRGLLTQLAKAATEGVTLQPEALISIPGVVITESDPNMVGVLDEILTGVLEEALANLVSERAREGEALRQSIREMQVRFIDMTKLIEEGRGEVIGKYRERLIARLDELLGPKAASLDPGRLEQEIALFTDKADIAEECTRLSAHLVALGDLLNKENEPVGRATEFLTQEILRETNTIGSKCRDLEIARHVLDLKNELESLRELIANVE